MAHCCDLLLCADNYFLLTREEDHARPGQHQDVDRTPVEESVRMTEDRDKWRKYVHGVVKPRIAIQIYTSKEQIRTDSLTYFAGFSSCQVPVLDFQNVLRSS